MKKDGKDNVAPDTQIKATQIEKPLLKVLSGEPVSPPPIWLMRQAGRYLPEYRKLRSEAPSFLEFCYTPDLAVEATLQPIRRFDLDAAILFSDILVIPDALGAQVEFVEGRGPVLDPIRDASGLGTLSADSLAERCAPVYAALEGVREALPETVALIGFAGGPWTVATYMVEGGSSRDFGEIKGWMWRDPDGFGRLIDLLTEATCAHLLGQIEAGADCVQLFESWSGVLPEPEFERWVVAPTRKIVSAIRSRHPRVPVIGFPRGAGAMIERYAEASFVDGVGLDQTVPLGQARHLQQRVAVQGNLDPLLLLNGGRIMADRVVEIVHGLKRGPHIFNLGHGVVPATDPDNVAELIRRVRGL